MLEREGSARSIMVPDKQEREDDTVNVDLGTNDSLLTRMKTNDGVDIKERISVPRPEDKVNSRCLFFTAATGYQESKETVDISELKHGVFTTALLKAYKKNSNLVAASKIFQDIQSQLQNQYIKSDEQEPTMVGDKNRYSLNLLGSTLIPKTQTVTTKVKAKNESNIFLEGGASIGLGKGNILASSDKRNETWLKIISVNANETATAVVTKGDSKRIKAGDLFEVKDWHTVSRPRIKLYLPAQQIPLQNYNKVVKELFTASQNSNFTEYNHYRIRNYTYLYYDNGNFVAERLDNNRNISGKFLIPVKALSSEKISEVSIGQDYFVNLPIPAEVMASLVKKLSTNQNIELVSDPSKADFGLYSAIVKDKKWLAFLCSTEFIGTKFSDHVHMGEENEVLFKKSAIEKASIDKITDDLKELILLTAASKGWLNDMPKRK
jgi:hypothetical protein